MVDHPHIVKMEQYKIVHNKMYIVMEYADGGDMKQQLDRRRKGILYHLCNEQRRSELRGNCLGKRQFGWRQI